MAAAGGHSHGNGTLDVTVPQAATISGAAGTAFAQPGTYNVGGSTASVSNHQHSLSMAVAFESFNVLRKT